MKKLYQSPVSDELLLGSESVMLSVSGDGLIFTPGDTGSGSGGR